MNTLGYLLVFAGLVIVRFVAKGRGLTDIPGDIGSLMTGVLTNDPKAIREVLGRGNDELGDKVDLSQVTSDAPDPLLPGGSAYADKLGRYNLGDVDRRLIPIAADVGGKFNIAKIIGWRADSGGYGDAEHNDGKAIDIFVPSKSVGDAVANYILANKDRFHVRYIIWYQRIYYPSKGAWQAMPDRGSVNANHKNHVHLSIS